MRTTLTRILMGAALVAAGFAVGALMSIPSDTDENAELESATQEIEALNKAVTRTEDRLWTLFRENEALKAQLGATSTSSAGTSTSSHPDGSYTDGIWIVGEDIEPGEYDGEITGDFGYWARLERTDGTIYAIIYNGIERGPFALEIIESDKAVELQGVVLTPR